MTDYGIGTLDKKRPDKNHCDSSSSEVLLMNRQVQIDEWATLGALFDEDDLGITGGFLQLFQ